MLSNVVLYKNIRFIRIF